MDKDANTDPSYVDANGWYGQWDYNPTGAEYAHETGHFLGIADAYVKVKYENNLFIGEQYENVPSASSNELLGLAATHDPKNAKVTQKDVNALSNYALQNQKDGHGVLKAGKTSLNAPSSSDEATIYGKGGEIVPDTRKKK